jgi:hypothetical protein
MTTPNYSPDGLTFEDITALEREVAEELRREGYPVPLAPSESASCPRRPELRPRRRRVARRVQRRPRQNVAPPQPTPRPQRPAARRAAPRIGGLNTNRSADQ